MTRLGDVDPEPGEPWPTTEEEAEARTRRPGRPPVGKVHEVRLPPGLAAAVRHAAKAAKVSAAEIHRRALAAYLKERSRDRWCHEPRCH